ncbi:hypothetical protein CC86DRAFT_159850 [Ophiobolus disseminans]|uniref:RGS domain-containing protein n=1 Tax=Ophiobolus disseminans TaxID=1469910 RepID=A0A6A7ACC0_9PLEO|nr:hypothetical protein CC86DRAFT_159850 [Ophiobolus disseminans]
MARIILDGIGWTYMSLFIVWNLAFAASMNYLWTHRQLPSLRMRRVPLLLAGLTSLHIYGAVSMLSYSIGPYVPCAANFWVMSIYLPFGIALFHASNSQFLYLASRQKHFARSGSLTSIDEETAEAIASSPWRRVFAGLGRADNIDRTLVSIGLGMIVQLLLTVFVFFGSRKFHPGYGIFDYTIEGTGMQAAMECSKGWEWWLSIIWQLFWAWIYAPYMLWKSRGIRDVHGWRLQTVCCCFAGLPASPLWLVGLYAPQFAPINAIFPPPVWYSVCIFSMELCAIGFPIAGVVRSTRLREETLEAIAKWEARQTISDLNSEDTSIKSPSAYSSTTTLKSGNDITMHHKSSFESQKNAMLTMSALENALRTNPVPLLEFAALKDFSGENVSFLTYIVDWRRSWLSPKISVAQHRRAQFISAVHIYTQFISLDLSEFPVNLSSTEAKRLHQVFQEAAVLLHRSRQGSITSFTSDSATPFDNVPPEETRESSINPELMPKTKSAISLDALGRANLRAVSRMREQRMDNVLAEFVIPTAFDELIMDAAERAIKYLVLTNTWPKFVHAGCENRRTDRDSDVETSGGWMRQVLCF